MAASRTVQRALRSNLARQVVPVVQKRGLRLAAAKVAVAAAPRVQAVQSRGMKTIDFAGTKEVVYGMTLFR